LGTTALGERTPGSNRTGGLQNELDAISNRKFTASAANGTPALKHVECVNIPNVIKIRLQKSLEIRADSRIDGQTDRSYELLSIVMCLIPARFPSTLQLH
jgi:hypothetical protein